MSTDATEAIEPARSEQIENDKPRSRRLLRNVGLGIGVLILLFYGGLGWLFSAKIQDDAFEIEAPGGPEYDVEVLDRTEHAIVLSLESDNHHLTETGIRGIRWQPNGYGQLGEIIASTDTSVTRTFTVLEGNPPPKGALVDLDGAAYPGDPQRADGLEYETVTYQSDIGAMEAWWVPGPSDSWSVFVHGKTGPLRDSLRILPALHEQGHNVLVIKYRNDVGVPEDPSREYGYGQTEWRDLEGAVEYALRHGADEISLMGQSMGGAIVTSFMLESDLAEHVGALVLDAPMLDFGETVDLGAANTTLPLLPLPVPQSLTNVAKVLAGWRFDIDWDAIDYFDEIDRLDTPVLLIHGTEDDRVPLETSERLARERPDITEFHRFDGAGHILSWNVDPQRYEDLVTAFLAEHAS